MTDLLELQIGSLERERDAHVLQKKMWEDPDGFVEEVFNHLGERSASTMDALLEFREWNSVAMAPLLHRLIAARRSRDAATIAVWMLKDWLLREIAKDDTSALPNKVVVSILSHTAEVPGFCASLWQACAASRKPALAFPYLLASAKAKNCDRFVTAALETQDFFSKDLYVALAKAMARMGSLECLAWLCERENLKVPGPRVTTRSMTVFPK